MTDFQIVIASASPLPGAEDPDVGHDRFAVRQNSKSGAGAIARIDELAEIWEIAVEKLGSLAARTRNAIKESPYELETIEFNIGIEAGLSIGLVTKGEASVSISFKKRDT
jgi:hypothetical protein